MTNKKKKNKKQTPQMLLFDYISLNKEQQETILTEIERKLLREAHNIIGIENAILLYDLFIKIYGIESDSIEVYKRIFWYEIIKKCMKRLRRDMKAYFILGRNYAFILKSHEEAVAYKKFLQKDIESLKNSQKNADVWVERKMWRKL